MPNGVVELVMESPRSYKPNNVVKNRPVAHGRKKGSKIGLINSRSSTEALILLAREKHKRARRGSWILPDHLAESPFGPDYFA